MEHTHTHKHTGRSPQLSRLILSPFSRWSQSVKRKARRHIFSIGDIRSHNVNAPMDFSGNNDSQAVVFEGIKARRGIIMFSFSKTSALAKLINLLV